jgi:hypothetical protein
MAGRKAAGTAIATLAPIDSVLVYETFRFSAEALPRFSSRSYSSI